MAELLTIDEAQRQVLAHVRPLAAEQVALEAAAGRVLAEPAPAVVDLPPFASSAMDGFAVRAVDTPGTLPIVARIAAGRPADRALGVGQAMAIATGGAVPEGADAVVPIELAVDHGGRVEVSAAAPGAHVRPAGGDVRSGAPVVAAGTRLGPAQLGALAAAGVAAVLCALRPRAVVLSTGTELRRPGEPLGPGEIYESNSAILVALLGATGASVERLATVEDDEEAHRNAIARGLEADLFVTTGGVSVGPHDLVRRVERELGVEEVFWGVGDATRKAARLRRSRRHRGLRVAWAIRSRRWSDASCSSSRPYWHCRAPRRLSRSSTSACLCGVCAGTRRATTSSGRAGSRATRRCGSSRSAARSRT